MKYVIFLIALILFMGGLVLMGYAPDMAGYELVAFLGGILAVSLAVIIPAHLMKSADR